MTFYDPIVQNLVALLHCEFSDVCANEPLADSFRSMSDDQWTTLFKLAACQGVLAIAYDALKHSGLESLPPREVRLRWALSAENIKQRYDRQHKAASELAAMFAGHGIRMLIFKGLSLSRYYPNPQSRECGDIDIYLFGDYDRANAIIESMGIEIDYENDKHAVFTFNGVMVENHATLTDCDNRSERTIEKTLQLFAKNTTLCKDGYYTPSPEFSMLFVLRHSARHFTTTGILFRHLFDWGTLLKYEAPKADMQSVAKFVADSGLAKFWNISTRAAEVLTGLPLPFWIDSKGMMERLDSRQNQVHTEQSGTRAEQRNLSRFLDYLLEDGENSGGKPLGNEVSGMTKVRITLASSAKYRFVPDGYLKMRLLPATLKILCRPRRLFE